MERLLDIVRNGSDADARAALKDWLDRVYGRPVQPTEEVTAMKEPETLAELRAMPLAEKLVLPAQRRAAATQP